MNISADTVAIMLTIAIAVGGGAWAVRGMIGRLGERVSRMEVAVQNLAVEMKAIRKQISFHRHHATGEVYYERDIVSDETEATVRG